MIETTDQAQPAIKAKSPWWHTVLALAIAIVVVKLGGMIAAIAAFAAFYFIRPRFGMAAAVVCGLAAAAVAGIAAVTLYSVAVPPAMNSSEVGKSTAPMQSSTPKQQTDQFGGVLVHE